MAVLQELGGYEIGQLADALKQVDVKGGADIIVEGDQVLVFSCRKNTLHVHYAYAYVFCTTPTLYVFCNITFTPRPLRLRLRLL